jgi:hypothetical protein
MVGRQRTNRPPPPPPSSRGADALRSRAVPHSKPQAGEDEKATGLPFVGDDVRTGKP